MGDFEKSVEMYKKSLKIKNNHYGENKIESSFTIMNLGVVYKKMGYYSKAMEMY